jgi:hypothetical protein
MANPPHWERKIAVGQIEIVVRALACDLKSRLKPALQNRKIDAE